jgi:hypothetical protein
MNTKPMCYALSSAPLITCAGTNINVTGQVIASPCVVDTGTVSKVVNLGKIQSRISLMPVMGASGLILICWCKVAQQAPAA